MELPGASDRISHSHAYFPLEPPRDNSERRMMDAAMERNGVYEDESDICP